jgi:hypothetical protein
MMTTMMLMDMLEFQIRPQPMVMFFQSIIIRKNLILIRFFIGLRSESLSNYVHRRTTLLQTSIPERRFYNITHQNNMHNHTNYDCD